MRIRLRERDPQTRRWHTVIDQRVSVTSCTRIVPQVLSESSDLQFLLAPDKSDGWGMQFDARVLIGNFAVASTLEKDRPDYVLRIGADARRALGSRLAAAFEHMHLLVFHPRDADPVALHALLDAGWSTTDIVTLSQIAAFLSFQIRVVAGLRILAGRS